MVVKTGTARNPFTSRVVDWALAKCLQREADVAESMGITVWGIGDADHLDNRPAGGHTPWRDGSPVGIVWAIDIMVDHKGKKYLEEFERFVISYCKSNADTTWIRFFNLNGSQYNFAGTKRRSSGDYHFHLEVENGKQNAATGLMAAWKAHKTGGPKPTTPKPPTKPDDADRKVKPDMFLIRKDGAVYKTNARDFCEHVPGPSTRQGYKDLVAVLGQPVEVAGDLKDFGLKESK